MFNDKCSNCGATLPEGRSSSDCPRCDGTGNRGESEQPRGKGQHQIVLEIAKRIVADPTGADADWVCGALNACADLKNPEVAVPAAIEAMRFAYNTLRFQHAPTFHPKVQEALREALAGFGQKA